MSLHHILITGASSGIGEALARHYAQPGRTLSLCARNLTRLNAVAQACEEKGAEVRLKTLDIFDRHTTEDWIRQSDDFKPVDLVIANAGISSGSSGNEDWAEQTRDIFAVNVGGVLNTTLPLMDRMRTRGQGQIAIVSSLAGFRGLGTAPAYSASKVCVKALGEAWRLRFGKEGIKINVICPGFVKSRITAQNNFKMPLLMDGPDAARAIAKGLEKDKATIAFPFPMAFATRLFAALPFFMVEWISRLLPKKE